MWRDEVREGRAELAVVLECDGAERVELRQRTRRRLAAENHVQLVLHPLTHVMQTHTSLETHHDA